MRRPTLTKQVQCGIEAAIEFALDHEEEFKTRYKRHVTNDVDRAKVFMRRWREWKHKAKAVRSRSKANTEHNRLHGVEQKCDGRCALHECVCGLK
jgi:hypothetical protein